MLTWSPEELGTWSLLSTSGRRSARVIIDGHSGDGGNWLRCSFRISDLPDTESNEQDVAIVSNMTIPWASLINIRNSLYHWLTEGTLFDVHLSSSEDGSCRIALGEHLRLITNTQHPAISINLRRATYEVRLGFLTDETCLRISLTELDKLLKHTEAITGWSGAPHANLAIRDDEPSDTFRDRDRYHVLLTSIPAAGIRDLARIRTALDSDVSLHRLRGIEKQDLPLVMARSRTSEEVDVAMATLGGLKRHLRLEDASRKEEPKD